MYYFLHFWNTNLKFNDMGLPKISQWICISFSESGLDVMGHLGIIGFS